jgi:hypothetical protein
VNTNIWVGGAVFVGASIILLAFFFRDQSPAAVSATGGAILAAPERPFQEATDTDGDGIKDWQESFDGSNPLVAQERIAISDESWSEPASGSMTEELARQIFEKNAEVLLKNGTITEADQELILAELAPALSREPDRQLLTSSHVITHDDNSTAAIRAYGNAIGAIINNSPSNEHELIILHRALTENKPGELAKLEVTIDGYAALSAAVMETAVPSSFTTLHLALLNALVAVRTDIVAFRGVFDDPVKAITFIDTYERDAETLADAIIALNQAFTAEGIVYGDAEGGAVFNQLTE